MSLDRQLVDAIVAEDPEQVRDLLTAATEKQRRAADDPLRDELQHVIPPRDPLPERRRTALLAILGTSTSKTLRAFHLARFGIPVPPAVAVLEARPAAIRSAMLKAATSDVLLRWLWPVAFDFIRRDQFTRPDTAEYAEGALGHVFGVDWRWPMDRSNPTDEQWIDGVRERLSDPDLADELFAAFRHEEPLVGLSTARRRPVEAALVRAAGDGAIQRSRLLDECLDGHLRDFRPSATRMFARLWDELAPTHDELVARQHRITRVGSAQDPGAQLLALTALGALLDGGETVDPAQASAVAAAALSGTTKKLATSALRFLDRLATIGPDPAVTAALSGVGHPRADVQEASLAFVERNLSRVSDPLTVRQDVLAWADAVEPQLRALLDDVTGIAATGNEPVGPDGDRREIARRVAALSAPQLADAGLHDIDPTVPTLPPPVTFDPWSPPVLSPQRATTRIDDPAELAEAVVAWMAGSVDGIDVERILDGLARLGAASAGTAAASAVRTQRERLRETSGTFADATPIVWLADAWLDRRPPQPLPFVRRRARWFGGRADVVGDLVKPRVPSNARRYWLGLTAYDGTRFPAHPAAFGAVRMWEVAHHLAEGQSRQLLATPTHRGGWIAPADLCHRLEEMQRRRLTPDRFDAVQALLRIAPGVADGLGDRLVAVGTDPARAAASILGHHARVRDEGLQRAARIRVDLGLPAASRRPGSQPHHAPQHALRWPDIADAGERRRDDPVGILLTALATPPDEIRWWHDANVLLAGADHTAMSRATTALPRFPDLYGAAVATTVAFDLGANRSSDADHVALATLIDPDVPLGPGAHAGLAIALTARNETLATVAADLTIAAIDDGRLDHVVLGELLATLVNEGVGLLSRPASRLSNVAEHSLLHADAVRRVWMTTLAALETLPRDLHAPLEGLLAAGTRCQRGVDDDGARSFLEQVATGSSKRASLARTLLELPTVWDDVAPELLAIAGRLTRAERWAAQLAGVT